MSKFWKNWKALFIGVFAGIALALVLHAGEPLSALVAAASVNPTHGGRDGGANKPSSGKAPGTSALTGGEAAVDSRWPGKGNLVLPSPSPSERPVSVVREYVATVPGLKPLEPAGWKISPQGTCDMKFKARGGKAPAPAPPAGSRRPRVGISVVLIQRSDWIHDALTSLVNSDIMDRADVAVFVWLNQKGSDAAKYMATFDLLPVVEVPNPTGQNEGIVVPRMKIMEAMMAHGCGFDWYLETHDDMYFFDGWFSPLIDHDKPDYGMLLPFIINGLAPVDKAREYVDYFTQGLDEAKNTVYINCIQVHPWLLKRAFVEDVGYFDAAFSPHQYEDDDLYIRMIRGGWKSAAVRSSWVVHRGGMTRGNFLRSDNGNSLKFKEKHGIGAEEFKLQMLSNCHPAVEDKTTYRFPLAQAPSPP